MKSFRNALLAGAAILAASAASAGAADLYAGPPGLKDGPYAPPIMHSASWYLRGDVGLGWHEKPVMLEDGIYDLIRTSIDRTWTLGGGVGYYFTQSVRGDITYDHRFKADVYGTNAVVAGPNPATFPGLRSFSLKSDVVLFNLYYDFGGRGRFNPYIGAGLGFAHHTTGSGTVTDCGCVTATFDGASNWHVAGALMAGVTMKMHERLHIDAGYRLLYLGETHTGVLTGTNVNVNNGQPTVGGDPIVSDMLSHELRLGIRWDIR